MALTEPVNQLDSNPTDRKLLEAALDGDPTALEPLYRRHHPVAFRLARAIAINSDDAADAVAEAFTRLFRRIHDGTVMPDIDFRAYLLTTVRNAAVDQHRGRRRFSSSDTTLVLNRTPSVSGSPDEHLAADQDSIAVARAFADLPERWRSVLWLTEVEGMKPGEAAGHLGVSANNAAQLATRARRRLRARYLQAHVASELVAPECQPFVELLGAYVAAQLPPRDLARVDEHVASCRPCRERVEELEDVGGILARIIVPIPLVVTAGVAASLRNAGFSPGVAEAAAVASGAAAAGTVAVSGTAGGTTAGAGAAGTAGPGGSGAASGASGSIGGLGANGMAVAATVAAWVVAAASFVVLDDGGTASPADTAVLGDTISTPIADADGASAEESGSTSTIGDAAAGSSVAPPALGVDGPADPPAVPGDADPDPITEIGPPLAPIVRDSPRPAEPDAASPTQISVGALIAATPVGLALDPLGSGATGAVLGPIVVGDPVPIPEPRGALLDLTLTIGDALPPIELGL